MIFFVTISLVKRNCRSIDKVGLSWFR